jgi:diguanylate cyclase (GGDEF)-like protein/PAS domain S-box-containing protein
VAKPISGQVAELQRANQALGNQLRLIEHLIEAIPSPIFYKDENGRYLGCNRAYAKLAGATREALIGKTAHDIWPKETADKIQAADDELLRNPGIHESREYESSRNAAGGERHDMLMRKTTFLKSDGSVGGILATMWDVTEKKRAEQAVKDKLNFIEHLIEAIPSPIFHKDENGRYLGCNRAYAKLAGMTREALIGKTAHDIWPKETADKIQAADDALLKNSGIHESQEYESSRDAADGTRRDMLMRKTTFLKSDGGIGGILGTMWDITEKKRTERAFESQLQLVQQLIEAIPSPVFYKDENKRYLGCNRAFEQFIGKTRMELFGKTAYDIWSKELADTYSDADDVLLKKPGTQQYEAPLTSADGKLHSVMFHRATILKSDGSVGGLISVAFDITEKKMLEQSLRDQALHDPLTSLYNRRYLDEVLQREFARAGRSRASIGIVMSDIDHFKRINDTFGHDCGDEVLRRVARTLSSHVREGDVVCRYGGEEFTIILPGASLDQTRKRAEQIRESIGRLEISHGDAAVGPITMSFGIATFPDHGQTPRPVVKAADEALMHAKESGRNRVVAA